MPVLAVLLSAALGWAADGADSHRAPAPSMAERHSAAEERRETLADMSQRKLIAPEAQAWSTEDSALLGRMRRAEAAGAVAVMRRRVGGLQGLAVEHRAVGAVASSLRLTKDGFARYLALRTQDALQYFESREIGAKLAFKLADVDGRPLFDGRGQLSEAGERVVDRARAGREAHWRLPSGEIAGNRRPPAPRPAPAPAPAPPVRPQPRRVTAPPPEAAPEPAKAEQPKAEPAKDPGPTPGKLSVPKKAAEPPKAEGKPPESESP